MRILLVEDDPTIVAGLRASLKPLGWAIDSASSIAAAWTALCTEAFDTVVLDLGLSDGDGRELLFRLRSAGSLNLPDERTPVLIMTARDQVASRIEALDAGADDYVTKPFDSGELAARIRALKRRALGRAASAISHGQLRIDPAARTVSMAGCPIELSVREFSVLLALVEASPRVLSRAQLEMRLYEWGRALDSNAIEVHIHRIRRKLGEDLIRTLRGVGYFVPDSE